MKYIVTENGVAIFSQGLYHKDVAKGCGKVLGAGHVSINPEGAKCGGGSVSLNIESRGKEDERAIDWMLNPYP